MSGSVRLIVRSWFDFYDNVILALWYLVFGLVAIAKLSGGWHLLAAYFAYKSCEHVALAVFAHSQLTRPHLWSYERWNLRPPKWLRDLVPQRVTKDRDGGEL